MTHPFEAKQENKMKTERAVRRCPHSSDGWNSGDKDELYQMFTAALTWDGNHASKESRDHLIANGYAYRVDGLTALTGKGKLAALFSWPMPRFWLRVCRRRGLRAFDREDQRSAAQ